MSLSSGLIWLTTAAGSSSPTDVAQAVGVVCGSIMAVLGLVAFVMRYVWRWAIAPAIREYLLEPIAAASAKVDAVSAKVDAVSADLAEHVADSTARRPFPGDVPHE